MTQTGAAPAARVLAMTTARWPESPPALHVATIARAETTVHQQEERDRLQTAAES